MTKTFWREYRRGAAAAVPMMLGFIPISLILGATGSQAGVSPLTMSLMTGINFAGGSEFAAVALWSAVPPFFVVMLTTWLINSRHIMLSAALTPYVTELPLRRALLIFFIMCDETWALAMQDISRRKAGGATDAEAFSYPFYLGVGISLWMTWVAADFTGAALGTGLGDLSDWGMAMAFPAIFIAILTSMWPGFPKCMPWIVSAAAAGISSLWLSSAWSVLIGSLAGLIFTWFTVSEDSRV